MIFYFDPYLTLNIRYGRLGDLMNRDMSVPCEEGMLNIRVCAIILRDGKFLMVGNNGRPEYLYSVGGRIKFGETAEEAVKREVLEETGYELEIDRLGFVHENYFYGDAQTNFGKMIYEISFFFYMKVPDDFEPECNSSTEDDSDEFLRWITPDEPVKYFPEFFRHELKNPTDSVKHFVTDGRK